MGKTQGGATDLVLSNWISRRADTDLLSANRVKERPPVGSDRACLSHVLATRSSAGLKVLWKYICVGQTDVLTFLDYSGQCQKQIRE